MTFLLYSDYLYQHTVEAFLISRKYAKQENITVLYYTIGFDSDLEYPNLIKVRWEIDSTKIDMVYYKPDIMIDALSYTNSLCFMDSDVVLSKRFDMKKIENLEKSYPLCCKGPVEFVWVWNIQNGIEEKIDEQNLMKYFGVTERPTYLWASMISYNEKCRDFLEEWASILYNPYLLKRHKFYFPFREETALNVLFWKRKITDHLELIFLNTMKFSSFLHTETEENFIQHIQKYDKLLLLDDGIYETCANSSLVQFYHGIKPGVDLDKTIDWMISVSQK